MESELKKPFEDKEKDNGGMSEPKDDNREIDRTTPVDTHEIRRNPQIKQPDPDIRT